MPLPKKITPSRFLLRLPPSAKPAQLRTVLPTDMSRARMGISFNMDNGEIVRMSLSVREAKRVMESLRDEIRRYRHCVHSPISSGNPSVSGSVVPGQSQ
jgi:hypothetical protein